MSAIDEVKQKLDIAEVIGQYTTLKKAGRNLTALCPFHTEKHPSFFVYPEQQSWHCFGACNTGGDVFAFVMKKEGLDFGETLRLLAQRAGVTLPSKMEPEGRKEEREELYQANDAAALYYHNLLLNSPAAVKAKSYVEKRGFTPKTLSDFQIGYSLDSWDALKLYLLEKGHSEKTQLTAGLLYEDEKGKTSDRFRGKLMIPIRDSRGRVTGFGARVLDNSEPKYKNSPQSPTFDKSGTLYGIDRAAAEIRKQDAAIIMEGYMDVIMAHQCGVTNAIASMGTAITETQIRILKRLSKDIQIFLCFDADLAGFEASERAGEIATKPLNEQTAYRYSFKSNSSSLKMNEAELRNAEITGTRVINEEALNIDVRIIILPEGKDPDEVIREDLQEWQNLVSTAVPIMDYMFEKTASNLNLSTAKDKSFFAEKLLPLVHAINDPIRQAHYLQKLAALVKVDMNTIKASLSRLKQSPQKRKIITAKPAAARTSRPLVSHAREEYFLALLLKNPELKNMEEDLSVYIVNSENREIYSAWREVQDLESLKERLDPVIHEHLDSILNKNLPGVRNNIEGRFADCVMELRKTYLKNLAARRSESGEADIDGLRLEEDMEISHQLRDLDLSKAKKRNSSFGRARR